MKKIKFALLIVSMMFGMLLTQAQDSKPAYTSGELLPKTGDIGASILIDGLIDNIKLNTNSNDYGENILFLKYYLKDDLIVRAGFGLNVSNVRRETADSSGVFLIEVDSTVSNYSINISGGIEKHLNPTKRLDPYVFSQIDLTFIGKTKTESETKTISSVSTDTQTRTIKRDGGLAFGLQAGGGFNYFLAERFSIGAEFAFRIQYVKLGGTISDNTSTVTGGNTVSNFKTREDLSKQASIGVKPNALINISYFF